MKNLVNNTKEEIIQNMTRFCPDTHAKCIQCKNDENRIAGGNKIKMMRLHSRPSLLWVYCRYSKALLKGDLCLCNSVESHIQVGRYSLHIQLHNEIASTTQWKREKCKLGRRGGVVDAKLPFQRSLRTNEYVTWNLVWFDDIVNRAKIHIHSDKT